MRSLIWFRADLRVADNPALTFACEHATRGAIAVFTVCSRQWQKHDWSPIKVHFILRHLESLHDRLATIGIPLRIINCETFDEVPDLLLDFALGHHCDSLCFNCEYELNERLRDRAVFDRFQESGLQVSVFTDQCIVPPGSIRTQKGEFYTVFTPFKKSWIQRVETMGVPTPLDVPTKVSDPVNVEAHDIPETVDGFEWPSDDMIDYWPVGESQAKRRLTLFIRNSIDDYQSQRDLPAEDGTSCLSPYLTVGSISIGQCLHAAWQANRNSLEKRRDQPGPGVWISELIWREFYRHVMVGYPRICQHKAFKADTDQLDWRDDGDEFQRWCEGRTGFPIVDAAMRQLNQTGWMHNRLRMIVAMFLTKDLYIDWRMGERYFMQNLIDGDLASNNGGWQWSASTGTDAAPYFRIFNPTSQSEKCDPDGMFIRRFIPELADLPIRCLHNPAKLAEHEFFDDIDYPKAMVDHKQARERVINAFKNL